LIENSQICRYTCIVSYRYIDRLFVKVIFVFGNHNGQNNNVFSNKNDENVHILVNIIKKKKNGNKQTNYPLNQNVADVYCLKKPFMMSTKT